MAEEQGSIGGQLSIPAAAADERVGAPLDTQADADAAMDDVAGHLLPGFTLAPLPLGTIPAPGPQQQGIVSPRDTATGQASGKRTHRP